MVVAGFTALAVGVSVLGGDLLNPPASTTDGDYVDETVELMIPLAEGGGTDTWARFVAAELTEAVPGKPGLAPTNDDGGEGILGTNHFMTSAEPDGTEVLVSTASTVVPYLLDMPAVQYDFSRLRPILANGTGAVVYARTAAGVKGVEDLVDRERPLVFGGIAATSLDVTTLLAFDLLGADVESTFGFEGRGPVNLALQRGEVDIDYQTTSSYGPAVDPLVKDGTAVPLFSLGQVDDAGEIVRDPNFPEVPTVVEAYEQLPASSPTPTGSRRTGRSWPSPTRTRRRSGCRRRRPTRPSSCCAALRRRWAPTRPSRSRRPRCSAATRSTPPRTSTSASARPTRWTTTSAPTCSSSSRPPTTSRSTEAP